MKRLFQLVPMIEIENYQRLTLQGVFQLFAIDEQTCILKHAQFQLTIQAKELSVQILKEELATIEIEELRSIHIEHTKDVESAF